MTARAVLLAEADGPARLAARKALERAGHRVVAADGIAGLMDGLDDRGVNVLVTGAAFPDGNAIDRMAEIRRRRPDLAIVLTGGPPPPDARTGEGGVAAFLPGPFPLDDLVKAVAATATTPAPREAKAGPKAGSPASSQASSQASSGPGGSLAEAAQYHISRFLEAHGRDGVPNGIHERIMAEVEKPLIEISLRHTKGNQLRASEMLGMNRNTLRKKIRLLGIEAAATRRGGRRSG